MRASKEIRRGADLWHSKRTIGITWITFNTAHRLELTDEQRTLACKIILEGHGVFYRVIAFVVMKDHVHLLIELNGTSTASRIVSAIKGRISKHLAKHDGVVPPVWQPSWYEMEVLGRTMLQQKIGYILKNAHHLLEGQTSNMPYCYVHPPLASDTKAKSEK